MSKKVVDLESVLDLASMAALGDAEASKALECIIQDANRWKGFINSSRIRFFGTAGPDSYDYAHFGGEFWTGVPKDRLGPKEHEATSKNREWLIEYADTSIKHLDHG